MEAELYDIYAMWHVPFWQKSWFLALLGCIGVVLVIGVIVLITRFVRSRKKPQQAWTVALANLDALKKSSHYSVQHSKDFYCALTDIFKVYVRARYNINTVSMTDEEWIAYLKQNQVIPASLLNAMDELVQGSVLIKFANTPAMSNRLDEDFQRVVTIVRDTIPVQDKG